MKLLSQALPQVRHYFDKGRWFTPAVVASLFALEVFGRRTGSDLHDTAGVTLLFLLVACVAIRHRTEPMAWVKAIGGFVWRAARYGDRFKVEFGPDLRIDPPLPRRLPAAVSLTCLALAAWAGLAVLVWWAEPAGWRPSLIRVSYLLYLACLSLLWGMMFVALFGGVFFPIMLLNYLAPRGGEPKVTRLQLAFLVGYLGAVTAASLLLPAWPVLAFCAACLVGVLLLNVWVPRPDAQLVWRAPGGSGRVYAVPPRRLLLAAALLVVLELVALIATSAGASALGLPGEPTTMPVTTLLGNWLAWLTPGILLSAAAFAFVLWRNSPARPRRPAARVLGAPAAERRRVRQAFRRRGWDAAFEGDPSPVEVPVRLVAAPFSDAAEIDPDWPLRVSVEDLEAGAVFDRLARRDEIRKRRLALRGLGRLFKAAAGWPRSPGGCGYWVAPHLWFVTGLTRDEIDGQDADEPTFLTETVGPPYHAVFHPAVRRYLHGVLKAVQADIVFVEDGVGGRGLVRAMRRLFEAFDKSGGTRRLDESDFGGLRRVKVIFHEFDVEQPYRSAVYPEPRFANLGRLRILHLFRDRGADEAWVAPPFDYDRSPAPSLVG